MFVVVQLLILLSLVELFVICMPSALRRVSKQNRFRLDGSVSDSRTYRERRATNRLRMDLLAVFLLVFLSGNAVYFTVDTQIMPVADIQLALRGGSQGQAPTVAEMRADEQWEVRRNLVILVTSLWVLLSGVIISAGAFRAYRAFGVGVHERSSENFHLDMTRMSISGSEFANEVLAKQSRSGKSAVG